jgi:cation transport ATPase
MERTRNSLTEAQKIEIIKAYEKYGPKWVFIGDMLNINYGTINPKMGRLV